MLDCSLIKYSLKLINKHIRHVFYLQFTMNAFQIYFLNAFNEVFFTMIYKIFVKHTSLFILGARFFVYLIKVLGAHAQTRT